MSKMGSACFIIQRFDTNINKGSGFDEKMDKSVILPFKITW